MVCLGNICRSPLAEGILKAKAEDVGLLWEVDSAGTSSYHNSEAPDRRSVAVAKSHGLDISSQRSRQITRQDLDYFDMIYVMDHSNYQNVLDLCSNSQQESKVVMIMNVVEENKNINVPDPYWGNDGFEEVYQMLDLACNAIIDKYN